MAIDAMILVLFLRLRVLKHLHCWNFFSLLCSFLQCLIKFSINYWSQDRKKGKFLSTEFVLSLF